MTGSILLTIFGVLGFLLGLGLLLYFWLDYAAPIPPAVPNTIRVACVGDSITYGFLIWGRTKKCYPAQLQILLGEKYSVRNFGVNGRTLLKTADAAYWKHRNFKVSTEFNPDIVLIMLGTNDSSTSHWKNVDAFIDDYREMLTHYRSLPAKPVVYLLTPPEEFIVRNRAAIHYNMSNEIVHEITSAIKLLAEKEKLKVIDINAATATHPECFKLDGIHPNAAGARVIAETVYKGILERGSIPQNAS